jgi:hypothetical protein
LAGVVAQTVLSAWQAELRLAGWQPANRSPFERPADFEIGDTAGLESLRYAGIVRVSLSNYELSGVQRGVHPVPPAR